MIINYDSFIDEKCQQWYLTHGYTIRNGYTYEKKTKEEGPKKPSSPTLSSFFQPSWTKQKA